MGVCGGMNTIPSYQLLINNPNPTGGDLLVSFRLGIKEDVLKSECLNDNTRLQLRPLWAERSELLKPLSSRR